MAKLIIENWDFGTKVHLFFCSISSATKYSLDPPRFENSLHLPLSQTFDSVCHKRGYRTRVRGEEFHQLASQHDSGWKWRGFSSFWIWLIFGADGMRFRIADVCGTFAAQENCWRPKRSARWEGPVGKFFFKLPFPKAAFTLFCSGECYGDDAAIHKAIIIKIRQPIIG